MDSKKIKCYYDHKNYKKLSEMLPLSTPLSIYIDPSNVCNFKCIFCPTGDKELLRSINRPEGIMDVKLLEKIIDDIKEFDEKVEKLIFYKDGEPLINKNLSRMIGYAFESDIAKSIELTTNGALLNRDRAIEIIESGLDKIRISVEHVNDAGYKYITKTNIKYDVIRKNVEVLYDERNRRKSKLHIHSKIVDANLSDEDKEKFINDFSKISDTVFINDLMGWSYSEVKDFTLGDSREGGNRSICPIAFYSMSINFNGLVSVCCSDWSMGTIIGDLKKEKLKDIWNGKRMMEFRTNQLKGKRSIMGSCKNCDYMQILSNKSNIDAYANIILEKYKDVI
ncbi:radical SAM protein [Wukongibacter baidiensis]|uniref:radical SAM/SPASM domain-containing protein n=1 Tax=Wukongibacter baidiensis TaxID=1723361 RepID=UPI003D7FF842